MLPVESWHWTLAELEGFVLIWLRVAGLFLSAPFFGSELVPERVKVMLSMGIAGLVWTQIGHQMPPLPPNLGLFIYACLAEGVIGVLLGLLTTLVFTAMQFAGQQIGMSMGITIANVLDPVTNENVSIIGQFKFFVAFFLFLMLNGHHYLIKALVATWTFIPPLTLSYRPAALLFVTETSFGRMFADGVLVAAPAVVAIFLVTIGMGFMARAAPEMNVFILGFGLRIGVGFFFLIATAGVFVGVIRRAFYHLFQDMDRLIRLLAPDAA